jgi:hypothetical protein
VSFNYFISDEVFRYIVNAVTMIAGDGYRLLPLYRFAPDSGLWRHRDGAVEPPLRLSQLSYETGFLTYPRQDHTAPESVLNDHLAEAAALFAALPDPYADGRSLHVADERLSADFEHLRWFDLPAESLEH